MNRDPYIALNKFPKFTLVSKDINDVQQLSLAQLSVRIGGQDLSPHLLWSGFPDQTKSFAVTVYDPDAPTPSGFWHWAIYNIPKYTTELIQGIGDGNGDLPKCCIAIKNDRGLKSFIGAAPPVGTGKHRYFFVVYALDVKELELSSDATPAFLAFNLLTHTVARASIISWYEQF